MSNLDQVMHDINKKFGAEVIKLGTDITYVEKIPLTSPRANYLTYGGIPLGKGTEFLGPEGGGKTTTALDAVRNAQREAEEELARELETLDGELKELAESAKKKDLKKKDQKRVTEIEDNISYLRNRGPRKCIYVDAENTLDVDWARTLGVDTDNLILMRPYEQTAEQVLQVIYEMLCSGDVYILVLDSIPMLVSQKLYAEDIDKREYAGIADAMARFCQKVSPVIARHKTALLMINQVRDNLKNPFDQWHTNGGRALRHFYGLRVGFRKGTFLDEKNNELPNKTEEPQGNRVDMTIVKTKVSKPDRRVGYYTLNYTNGIDVLNDTMALAMKYDFIVNSGAWYRFVDPETGEIMLDDDEKEMKYQGETKVLAFLRENQFIFEELYEAVNEKLKNG